MSDIWRRGICCGGGEEGPTLGKGRGAWHQSEEAGRAAIDKVRSSSKVFDRASTSSGRYDGCQFSEAGPLVSGG